MSDYIIITDSKGIRYAFYTFDELMEYMGKFHASFLDNRFNYELRKNTDDT